MKSSHYLAARRIERKENQGVKERERERQRQTDRERERKRGGRRKKRTQTMRLVKREDGG